MFEVVPFVPYAPVEREDDEALTELDELDFLQSISDAVGRGEIDPDEAMAMIEREEALNSVR